MALTPQLIGGAVEIGARIQVETPAEQPSHTYRVDWKTGRVGGYIDNALAVEQAIYKILQTQRFAYIIYSWNYGMENNRLLGQNQDQVRAELPRLIDEALTADDRIIEIADFQIVSINRRTAAVQFTAVTLFGSLPISGEVTI